MTIEEELFARFRGKSVHLDTNVLLVLLTGAVGTRFLGRFKRVSTYSLEDYKFLRWFLSLFKVLIATPHIFTEASNLANNALTGTYRQDWFANLAASVLTGRENGGIAENWTPAKELATMPEFVRFGIADCALAKLCPEVLVVTDDSPLSGALRNRGIDVLNFKDLRAMRHSLQ